MIIIREFEVCTCREAIHESKMLFLVLRLSCNDPGIAGFHQFAVQAEIGIDLATSQKLMQTRVNVCFPAEMCPVASSSSILEMRAHSWIAK